MGDLRCSDNARLDAELCPLLRRACLLAIGGLMMPAIVSAHASGGEAAGLLSGLQHPASGLDHVAAMFAVGLWGAQLGAPALWVLPVTFPVVMAVGGMLGLMGLTLPGVELAIALSAILLGAMVTFRWRASMLAATLLVGIFAIFHGHAHGTELPTGANAMLYSVGFVIGTGLIHAAGISVGLLQRWRIGGAAIRVAGLLIALAGVGYLWRAIS